MSSAIFLYLLIALSAPPASLSADIVAASSSEIRAALAAANRGDRILIAPGVYPAGFSRANLRRVTITSLVPDSPAVLRGGTNAIELNDASDVTVSNIICEGQFGNGLNIADGGSFATPATNILVQNVTVRDMVGTGNLDGIKLSGVTGFTIRNVHIVNWGAGGSAIDPTGSHNGLVENSYFSQDSGGFASALRAKGGAKNIIVRANRLQLGATETAMTAGGTTGTPFFRFIDGDSGYEANNVTFEGNVVVGCRAAMSFEHIDGGIFHHNYLYRPKQFAVRYLPGGNPINTVITQNGRVEDNVFVYMDTPTEYSRALNVGPDVRVDTLRFRRNTWVNLANPADSAPSLPTVDRGATFGVLPRYDQDDAIPHRFSWGVWCVNAVLTSNVCRLPGRLSLQRAIPSRRSSFNPLLDDPFIGKWKFRNIARNRIRMKPMTQAYFRVTPAGV